MRPATLIFAILWALLTGWTIRRLWRAATDRYSRLVYTYGVRWFGILFLIGTILAYVADGAPFRKLIIQFLVGAPLSLWAGYLFGRGLAWSFGVEPGDRAV